MVRKILTWGLGLFVIFYLFTDPTGAAGFVHSVLHGLHTLATSLTTFVNSL
jgi:hypothetical protein